QATSKTKVDIPVEEEVKEKAKQEAKEKLKQDISLLQQFSMEVYKKIQNKAAGEIKNTFLFWEETRKSLHQGILSAHRSEKDAIQEAQELIEAGKDRSLQTVSDAGQAIANDWNVHWLERIVDLIKIVDPEKAKSAVAQLKQKNPTYPPAKIAQQLINEKLIWATAGGAIASQPAGTALVDLSATVPLLVQMVFEIVFAYDNKAQLPQQQKEILTVFALALSRDNLGKLSLSFLLKNSPIPSWSIDPLMNGLLFLTTGYTGCQYLEAKTKQTASPATSKTARIILDNQIDAYLAEAQTEQLAPAIGQVFKWAISLKQQLGIS
ncbi:MAG: hypothetical protein F6K35_30580, partial [Okeania sp. SIO2H7]|nr:hypothetical protein [Okeania sp. SIO2H7]